MTDGRRIWLTGASSGIGAHLAHSHILCQVHNIHSLKMIFLKFKFE